jgi:hypothetical protein
MSYKQTKSFNQSEAGKVVGDCLKNVRLGYNIPSKSLDAWAAWEATDQHTDAIPTGVDVPLYYSYDGASNGHINVRLANGQVWSDGTVYASVAAFEAEHTPKYVGWSTSVDGEAVIEAESTPAPAPAAPVVTPTVEAPAVASEAKYTVNVALKGYTDSDDAINHLGVIVDMVQPGSYFVFNTKGVAKNLSDVDGGMGSWVNTNDNQVTVISPPAVLPVSEVVPAPAPTAATPTNIEYTKLDEPLSLFTNKQPTNIWNLGFATDAQANAVQELTNDTPFAAYGKGQRTDGDKHCYYMTEGDFGDADTSGIPTNNFGVNTVDLSLPTTIAPVVAATPTVAPAPSESASTAGETVAVKVLPPSLDNKYQYTKFLSPQPYKLNQNITVTDLNGIGSHISLKAGQNIHNGIAGKFTANGITYVRPTDSVAKNEWYNLPESSVTKTSDEIDDIASDVSTIMKTEPKIVKEVKAVGGTVDGFFSRLSNPLKSKNKQGAKK